MKNQHLVSDSAEDGTQFALRMAHFQTRDDALTYGTGPWFTKWKQGVFVECRFDDKGMVRPVSNGDTVDISGETTDAQCGR